MVTLKRRRKQKRRKQRKRELELLNLDLVHRPRIDLLRFEGKILLSPSNHAAQRHHLQEVEVVQENGVGWRRRAAGQRNRKWEEKAYILKDDGASENFVSRDYIERLKRKGADVPVRDEGWMTVRTARVQADLKKEKRQRAKLHVQVGSYTYVAWFTVFDIDTYDVVLGKR